MTATAAPTAVRWTPGDFDRWAEASVTGNGKLAATLPLLPPACTHCGQLMTMSGGVWTCGH